MDANKFKEYMREFSITQLKYFLGDNLSNNLIEWSEDYENLFTKSKLVNMIEMIHGYNIFKNKEFRKEIIYQMPREDILSFKALLGNKYNNINNIDVIIDAIVNKKWGKNQTTAHLLSLLNINENIFLQNDEVGNKVEHISSYNKFYELLDYQFVIKQQVLNIISSDIKIPRLLIHMPTGTGKTKTTMHTIVHHHNFNNKKQGLIIWMAHTTELLDQALETLTQTWKHLGHDSVNIYKLFGDYELDVSLDLNGFMICGFQKLISIKEKSPVLFANICNQCRLVVVDEAHKAVAEKTKDVINELLKVKQGMADRGLIGLTATPGRDMVDDVDNNRLVKMFENRIVSIDINTTEIINLDDRQLNKVNREKDIINYMQNRRILAKVKRDILSYDKELPAEEFSKLELQAALNGFSDFSSDFLKVIGGNKKRNMSIINKLLDLHSGKIPTIVFACSVEHGKLLSSALTLKNAENAFVYGDLNPIIRKKYIEKFKDKNDSLNIIINYGVLTTGFDATNIRCVFITRPTYSIVLYSQMLGRGLRGPKMGGNDECLLIDIEDNLERYNSESLAFKYFNNYWN